MTSYLIEFKFNIRMFIKYSSSVSFLNYGFCSFTKVVNIIIHRLRLWSACWYIFVFFFFFCYYVAEFKHRIAWNSALYLSILIIKRTNSNLLKNRYSNWNRVFRLQILIFFIIRFVQENTNKFITLEK